VHDIGSEEREYLNKKTAHELSHERAEIRYLSRLPAWQQQQQQQPVTSSEDQQTASSIVIAGCNYQACGKVRRCKYWQTLPPLPRVRW